MPCTTARSHHRTDYNATDNLCNSLCKIEPVLSYFSHSPGFRLDPRTVWIPWQVDTAPLLSHPGLSSKSSPKGWAGWVLWCTPAHSTHGVTPSTQPWGTLAVQSHRWDKNPGEGLGTTQTHPTQSPELSSQERQQAASSESYGTVFKTFSWYCNISSIMKNKTGRSFLKYITLFLIRRFAQLP